MTRAPVRHPQPPTLDVADVGWQADAACLDQPPYLWDTDIADAWKEGQRICRTCPVIDDCTEYAMRMEKGTSHSGRWGIFGGLTPRQRERLARPRRGRIINARSMIARFDRGEHGTKIGATERSPGTVAGTEAANRLEQARRL